MAEIKREPVKITVDGVEYDAFDEAHTIADVCRWLIKEGNLDPEDFDKITKINL